MKYKLLALDVDGTLLGPDHTLADETIEAIKQAQEAGLKVCIATGRSYIETLDAWKQLRLKKPYQPMIVVGGALVCEPDTGRTLYQTTIQRELACEFADALNEQGYSALALVDSWRHGFDYYLAASSDARQVHSGWFAKMNVTVCEVDKLCSSDDMAVPLRIHSLINPEKVDGIIERMQQRFDGQLYIHAIYAPNYEVTILEAFSIKANKWTGLSYIAQGLRIPPSRIVAVGDDINDLPMLAGADLGVAMPQSPDNVKEAADMTIEKTLAEFIRQLIAGKFQ